MTDAACRIRRAKDARLFAVVAVATALAGCAVGPDYKRPALEVGDAWTEERRTLAAAPDEKTWWESFGDPVLTRLVERALEAAPRMHEAEARVREARELRRAQVGALFPRLDGEASYSNSRISQNGFLKGLGSGTDQQPSGAVFPGQQIDLFQTGFDAQWEIDLFGHVRRTIEAAGADLGAAEAGAADVARSLAAETAREVVEARSFDERLVIAGENIAAQRETLDILRQRRAAGIASEAEVARVDAQLASTESDMPQLRARRAACVRRLEALVALPSGSLEHELASGSGAKTSRIPSPALLPPTGLPSDLLLQRPDVSRAERELAAATARIGVARSELFPRFSLTGSFGVQSQNVSDLFTSDSRFWYIGPGLRWPIFDAGRLRAAMHAADARTDAAAARYEQTVRTAIAEVETALTSLAEERERASLLEREARDEALATDATRDQYRSGLTDLLHVLDAERQRYRAEDALAVSRAALAEQAIALYKALGGGWPAAGTATQPAASREITESASSSPRSVSATASR